MINREIQFGQLVQRQWILFWDFLWISSLSCLLQTPVCSALRYIDFVYLFDLWWKFLAYGLCDRTAGIHFLQAPVLHPVCTFELNRFLCISESKSFWNCFFFFNSTDGWRVIQLCNSLDTHVCSIAIHRPKERSIQKLSWRLMESHDVPYKQ